MKGIKLVLSFSVILATTSIQMMGMDFGSRNNYLTVEQKNYIQKLLYYYAEHKESIQAQIKSINNDKTISDFDKVKRLVPLYDDFYKIIKIENKLMAIYADDRSYTMNEIQAATII